MDNRKEWETADNYLESLNQSTMDKHIERLNALAEKMAESKYELFPQIREKCIAEMLPLAELALRECAEEVTKALSHGYHVKCDEIKGEPSRGYGGKYLQSLGLIPEKTKE